MAVELAKVSLWLDCFTLGAPLSFLDHHLKCGNSLIGTTVQEVEAESATKEEQTFQMFGGPFQGLLSATALVEELRRLPDATIDQAERSHALYDQFEQAMAPFKTALDIWVSRYFGNKLAQEYLTLVGQNYVEEIRSGGKGLSPQYREVITKASQISQEKRFFHWDLEFPEAFVDLEKQTWKPGDRQGFDAVFGNPPYDVLATKELGYDITQELYHFKNSPRFGAAIRGKVNLYKLFICQANLLIHRRGQVSFIVPMTLLGDDQAQMVRKLLLTQTELHTIECFPQKDDPKRRVFAEAKLPTAIFVTKGCYSNNAFQVRTHPSNVILDTSERFLIKPGEVSAFDPENLAIPSCTQRDWAIVNAILNSNAVHLKTIANLNQGEINETTCCDYLSSERVGPRVLRGANICLYSIREASQGTQLHINAADFLKNRSKHSKAWDHKRNRVGIQRMAPLNNFRRLIGTRVAKGEFCFDSINYVTEEDSKVSLDLLLIYLNSKTLDWYFRILSTNSTINEYQFNILPVPSLVETERHLSWKPLLDTCQWQELEQSLKELCGEKGEIPEVAAQALIAMSQLIQEIEARRVLRRRAERSSLASQSQPIQNVIDAVLFRCYGLSDEDAKYVERRLGEML